MRTKKKVLKVEGAGKGQQGRISSATNNSTMKTIPQTTGFLIKEAKRVREEKRAGKARNWETS